MIKPYKDAITDRLETLAERCDYPITELMHLQHRAESKNLIGPLYLENMYKAVVGLKMHIEMLTDDFKKYYSKD